MKTTISYMAIPGRHTIETAVCQVYGIDQEQLYGTSREREVVEARQTAMYLKSQLTGLNFKQIGQLFNKDRATVHYAVGCVPGYAEHDKAYRARLTDIKQYLNIN